MPDFDIRVKATGPIFKPGVNRLVDRLVNLMLRDLADKTEERLNTRLRPKPKGVYLSVAEARKGQANTGNYRRNINVKTQDLHVSINDGGVIYGSWLEGTSSRNQTTRFKGYGVFRETQTWIEKLQGSQQFRAKWIRRLKQELSGRGI